MSGCLSGYHKPSEEEAKKIYAKFDREREARKDELAVEVTAYESVFTGGRLYGTKHEAFLATKQEFAREALENLDREWLEETARGYQFGDHVMVMLDMLLKLEECQLIQIDWSRVSYLRGLEDGRWWLQDGKLCIDFNQGKVE